MLCCLLTKTDNPQTKQVKPEETPDEDKSLCSLRNGLNTSAMYNPSNERYLRVRRVIDPKLSINLSITEHLYDVPFRALGF